MPFEARVKIVGVNPYVDVPKAVTADFGVRVLVKLRGLTHRAYKKIQTLSDRTLLRVRYLTKDGWFRANLMSTGKGGHILYLNGWMRNAARADVGDRVRVFIKADAKPRAQPTPPLFRAALAHDKKAHAAWLVQTPSYKKEVLQYLNFLKSVEALERNVSCKIQLIPASTDAFGGNSSSSKTMSVFDRWVEALCLSIDRARATLATKFAQPEELDEEEPVLGDVDEK